jgi:hypothetical protein
VIEAREVLARLERAGVRAEARADGALVLAPKQLVTEELRVAARAAKPSIVAMLRANGAEISRSGRWRAVAEMLARVDSLAPGAWADLYPKLKADRTMWAAIGRAEVRVDAVASGNDEDFAEALAELEAAWRAAVSRHRNARSGS